MSPKGRLKADLSKLVSVVDSLVLILLPKMSFDLVFRNRVGVDRESAEVGTKQKAATLHGQALAAFSGYRKKNLIWTGLAESGPGRQSLGEPRTLRKC